MDEWRRFLRATCPQTHGPREDAGLRGSVVATPVPINRNSRLSAATPNLPFARELTEITINRGGDKAEGRGRWFLSVLAAR